MLIGIPCWVWHKQSDSASAWPMSELILFCGIGVLGVILLLIGLLAPTRAVEWWADAVSRHEATIVVMIIAAPLYFLVRWVTRKR